MRLVLIFALVLSSFSAFAEEDLGAQFAPAAFVQKFKGDYTLELVNGQKPKPDNNRAQIQFTDDNEILLTFPFCEEGGSCDAGYIFMPVNSVQIFRKEMGQEREIYTFILTQDGKKYKYTLDIDGSKFTFSNYQYPLSNGQIITLVHIFKKPV